ncbi:MAG: hypothetical protein RLZ58_684 [Pseudomonadota bacterium]|jgi:prophage regulatory protein
MTASFPEALLRLPEVSARVGLRRSALYAAVQAGTFPPPVRIGKRAVAWPESEVQAWIEDRKWEAAANRQSRPIAL